MGDSEWKPNPAIREKILNEIIQTEKDYVKDLQTIINVYKKDLVSRGIITAEQERTLFSNVEELEELNRCDVFSKFEARFRAVQETGASLAVVNLGDIFLQLSDQLKWYTDYCANQPQALAMLDHLNSENKNFQTYHEMMMNEKKEISRGLSLLSFLIKPVQRLCKYPLLLRELINLTDPASQEYERLVDAAKKVGETVEFVNAMQKEAELKASKKLIEMEEIEKSIEGAEALQISQDKNLSINRVGLVSIYHIKKKKLVPRKVYLFNNLILIAKKNESKMKKKNAKEFTLDASFYIQHLVCSDMSNIADVKFGFELKNKPDSTATDKTLSTVSVLIACETLEQKREWLKDIKALVKDHQVAEAKRRAIAQGISVTSTKPSHTETLLSQMRPMTRSSSVSSTSSPMLRTAGRDIPVNSKSRGSDLRPIRKNNSRFISDTQSRQPEPPPDDGKTDWRAVQDEIDGTPIEPLYFTSPPRWGQWLEYQSADFGIPFFYNIQTKVSTWTRPSGWSDNNNSSSSFSPTNTFSPTSSLGRK